MNTYLNNFPALNKSILFIGIISSLLLACHKEQIPEDPNNDDPLPAITTEGAETFGCYINGEPWVPFIDLGVWDPLVRKITSSYNEGPLAYFNLYTRRISYEDSLDQKLYLSIALIFEKNKIDYKELNRCELGFSSSKADGKGTGSRTYKMDTLAPVKLEITNLDLQNNIISGLFEFTAINEDIMDTLKITEGRFDVTYTPY